MKYLLDTNVFIWSRGAAERLNDKAKQILGDAAVELWLSAASSWEISIKCAVGSLKLHLPPADYVRDSLAAWNIAPIDITHTHALAAVELPQHHRDPFDRMLIAQAREERMTLLTADRTLEKYDVPLIYCGK